MDCDIHLRAVIFSSKSHLIKSGLIACCVSSGLIACGVSQAFAELQAKVMDTQQKAKLADLQIEQLNRMKKHAHLTDSEITTLPDETRMYEGVGRMFILQSKEVIHSQLLEKQNGADEKIKELEISCSNHHAATSELQRRRTTQFWPAYRQARRRLARPLGSLADPLTDLSPLPPSPGSAQPIVRRPWELPSTQRKTYLERSVKDAEDNIREMLMARRSQ
ncbi:PFD1 protein, partial [Polyodon spathula]|nr:PFD1 protein [Polyodon spathula]